MNYRKHYVALMRKAQNRDQIKETYVEKHHVFPKSIFGGGGPLVKLTAREHYIAHLLIWKDFCIRYGKSHPKTIKLMRAFWLMSNLPGDRKVSSKMYTVAKEAISADKKGKPRSEELKQKLSKTKLGKPGHPHSEQSKLKISAAHKGKKLSPEHIEKSAVARRGRKMSDNQKKKISDKTKGDKNSMFGKTHSEEAKNKMSEAAKKRTHSPETKAKMSLAHKGKPQPWNRKPWSKDRKLAASIKMSGSGNFMFGKLRSPETTSKISKTKTGATTEEIREMVKYLIENEATPLSDRSISDQLKTSGFRISAATVQRHRVALGLPSIKFR